MIAGTTSPMASFNVTHNHADDKNSFHDIPFSGSDGGSGNDEREVGKGGAVEVEIRSMSCSSERSWERSQNDCDDGGDDVPQ